MVRLLALLLVVLLCSCADSHRAALAAEPGLSLPAPNALLKQLPKREPAKTSEAQVARSGAQYEPTLLNLNTSAQGSAAVLDPRFAPPLNLDFSDMACAMYRFDLTGYDRDNNVRLSWGTPGAQPDTWIGLADMQHNRWEWHACPLDSVVSFADPATYTAANGDALVAIVMAGVGTFELDQVRFGLYQATNHELWYYEGTNLQVQANVDSAIALMNRAADAGYTTCVLADSKLDHIASITPPSLYWDKLQQFDTACKARGVRLVPALCGLGWCDSLIMENPNLI